MKPNFNFLRTFALLAMLGASQSSAVTLTFWAQGVTEQSGWYDTNKGDNYRGYFSDSDSELCAVAAASNMIQWMQDRYGENLPPGIPNGKAIPSDVPQMRQLQVFNVLYDTFGNKAQKAEDVIQWWTTGQGNTSPKLTGAPSSGGYFPMDYSATDFSDSSKSATVYTGSALSLSEADAAARGLTKSQYICYDIAKRFAGKDKWEYETGWYNDSYNTSNENGVMVLNIKTQTGTDSHAITVWGIEYDADGAYGESGTDMITKIWYTDSNRNTDIGDSGTENTLSTASLVASHDNKGLYIMGDEGNLLNNWEVETWSILSPTSFTQTQIPEPASASLGILGLSALLLRRRRN